MPINTNVVTTGHVIGKTGTVTFRPYVGSKVPSRVPPRPTVGSKSVAPRVTSQNVSSKSAKRPSTGGKSLGVANKFVVKRKVNRSKQTFLRLKAAQKETHIINSKTHIERLLKKCLQNLGAPNMRMSAGFKEDFRSELEAYFIERLEKMQTVAIHAKRVMVKKKDNVLVRHMYNELDSRAVKKVAIVYGKQGAV